MTDTNGEDAYVRQITTTMHQPMGDNNYAHNIPRAGNEGNISSHGRPEAHQQTETTPDFIYLEIQEPPVSSTPTTDQRLQTPTAPVPSVVPQNQTTNSYQQTTYPPAAVNQGYVPVQQPPSYNELYGNGHPGFNPGPYTHQPQPFQTNYQSNVVVTTQPQPTPSNMVFVNSAPPRNTSQGLATASLVMAIIGIFCCFCGVFCTVPAIIFAVISLGNSTDPNKARTHANISMTCTVIGWISGIIIAILYFVLVISASTY